MNNNCDVFQGFNLHAHDTEEGHAHEEHGSEPLIHEEVWKSLLACLSIYIFFNMQATFIFVTGGKVGANNKKALKTNKT